MRLFTILLVSLLLLAPFATQAIELNLEYPTLPGAPDINDPEQQGLTDLIAWFYAFIVGIAGLAAFVMIVGGGILWMSSAGNPGQTAKAKDMIQKALLGLLLILISFLILQIINPELLVLQDPTPTF